MGGGGGEIGVWYTGVLGGGGIFVSVIFMNAKVIILSRTHKVREKEKG